MKAIDKFVDKLYKQKGLKDSGEASQLKEMLYEKVDDLQKEEGLSESQAIERTIEEFGDENDYSLKSIEKAKRAHARHKTVVHYQNDLLFAGLATALIAAIVFIINYVFVEDWYPWAAIIITLGVLFWPLSLFYKLLNRRGDY